jgi:peptidoglycan/LPS O-acetylase OafA/YrhL
MPDRSSKHLTALVAGFVFATAAVLLIVNETVPGIAPIVLPVALVALIFATALRERRRSDRG